MVMKKEKNIQSQDGPVLPRSEWFGLAMGARSERGTFVGDRRGLAIQAESER